MPSIRASAALLLALVPTLACRTAAPAAPGARSGSGAPSAATPAAAAAAAAPSAPAATAPVAVDPGQDDRFLAVVWFQTAAEYRILARTTFAAATAALDRALADPTFTAALEQSGDASALPPAVVVDIDETMLDNSPFEVESILAGRHYDVAAWNAWSERANARPIPGALEFARAAAMKGVTVFYVSNRDASEEAWTRKNLVADGFPVAADRDTLFFRHERPEWKSDKTSRRAEVAREFRIVALVGDDLNDFVDVSTASTAERDAVAARYEDRWGSRWFLLPNPYYGSWERANYDHERNLPRDEIVRRRLALLHGPE